MAERFGKGRSKVALRWMAAIATVIAIAGPFHFLHAQPAPPPPDLAGRWSITRTWYRSCPRCGTTIIRTTPWVITQTLGTVRVNRGPRGSVIGDANGGGLLALEGAETEGISVLRFWYGTLRVSADGNYFEGAFNGSEQLQNPCGSNPPEVTCFANAGWLRAQRIDPIATVPRPPGPPTAVASAVPPSASATATPIATPTGTSTAPPLSTPTGTPLPTVAQPSPSPTASPMPRPVGIGWLPVVER